MRLLNSIDRDQADLPYFVTLTYHHAWPKDRHGRKRQLDAFRKRLERQLGAFAAIWRLEFQKRGAPHYHLLLWISGDQVVKDLGDRRRDLRYMRLMRLRCAVSWHWNEVADPGNPEHFEASTSVESVRSWRGVNSYAAKYMGKPEQLQPGQSVGRFWGTWRRELLPISYQVVKLTHLEAFRIRRVLRGYTKMRAGRGEVRRFSCFVGASSTNRLLAWLGIIGTTPAGEDDKPGRRQRGSARSGASTQPRSRRTA